MSTNDERYTILGADDGWQPVNPRSPRSKGLAIFRARRCEYVVRSGSGSGVVFKGYRTADEAEYFADSLPRSAGQPRAIVERVQPYYYVQAYGPVDDSAVLGSLDVAQAALAATGRAR